MEGAHREAGREGFDVRVCRAYGHMGLRLQNASYLKGLGSAGSLGFRVQHSRLGFDGSRLRSQERGTRGR